MAERVERSSISKPEPEAPELKHEEVRPQQQEEPADDSKPVEIRKSKPVEKSKPEEKQAKEPADESKPEEKQAKEPADESKPEEIQEKEPADESKPEEIQAKEPAGESKPEEIQAKEPADETKPEEPADESKPKEMQSGELKADVSKKSVMVVGIDECEHSYYALEWTLDHFFASNPINFKLVIVHARPPQSKATGKNAGPEDADVFMPTEEVDLQKIAATVVEKAKEICIRKSVNDVLLEVVEGEAKSVMCEAVEKHNATILVVGTHGYGAIKRAVHGSVSDHCVHHAHCTVMVVKKGKTKN